MFIPFLVAKVFHIIKKSKNLKNVKRVYPKRKSKGKKNKNGQKVKEMNPIKNKGQGKCPSLNATTFYSDVINKLCAACQTFATIYEESNCLNLTHSFSISCCRIENKYLTKQFNLGR